MSGARNESSNLRVWIVGDGGDVLFLHFAEEWMWMIFNGFEFFLVSM